MNGSKLYSIWICHGGHIGSCLPLESRDFIVFRKQKPELVDALQRDDEGLIAACCTYLADRLPELKQIKARVLAAGFSVELVFDKAYVKEVTLDFIPRPRHE